MEVGEDGGVAATPAGRICSFYYLRHETLDLLMNHMHKGMDTKHLLLILCSCPEFDELPVRLGGCLHRAGPQSRPVGRLGGHPASPQL